MAQSVYLGLFQVGLGKVDFAGTRLSQSYSIYSVYSVYGVYIGSLASGVQINGISFDPDGSIQELLYQRDEF